MVDKIISLFERFGSYDYIGENVSQLEHALQCAHIAKTNNHDSSFIIACLLHDIGHLLGYETKTETMGHLGVLHHEKLGADWLREIGMSETVCELVESHIQSKRYLLTTQSDYYNRLSDASKQTFNYQGGQMSSTEIESFRRDPLFLAKLTLRFYDDQAKIPNKEVPALETYLSDLQSLIIV